MLSPHFDAFVALARGALVPLPDAPPLDNLDKCRPLLPRDHLDYRDARPAHAAPAPQGVCVCVCVCVHMYVCCNTALCSIVISLTQPLRL
jgi:hypothetical protein